MPASRGLDRIDVADHVSDGHIRRCQLLHVAPVPVEPRHGSLIALLGNQIAAAAADGMERIVADLTARNIRKMLVKKSREHPYNAGLGLPA